MQHQLLAKKSKCVFAAKRVEYLGHYIFVESVSTDPKKVKTIRSWSEPQFITKLRNFLGLAEYYRRFIIEYGTISKPLIDMLKKDNFCWNEKASKAFHLKETLTTTPFLILPDFSLKFVVENDAYNMSIGAVLMQKRLPIAFLSKGLLKQHQSLSVYEKELLDLVLAMSKWS